MNSTFSNNLKKFRLQKNMTQEQAAAALGVNAQTISRWECNTTLPDVTILPELARLYCVTVDDFFKETASVYQNYAQRLGCIYEKTREPEDFMRADLEFRQLQKSGAYSPEDMRMHGQIHQYMMWYCKEKALSLYDSVIEKEEGNSGKTYWMTRYAKANLMVLLGQADECISRQKERVDQHPYNPDEWSVLVRTCFYAKHYDTGYKYFLTAIDRFPGSCGLYYAGGDICRKLKRYDEAFRYWDKALELDLDRFGVLWSKASCYDELKDYGKAYETRCELVRYFKQRGYDVEAAAEEKKAQQCFSLIGR